MRKLLLILLCLPIIGFGQCENKCNEVITYTNAEYVGCVNENNKSDGYGELLFNDKKTSYKGCWKDGKKQGQGTYTWASGDKFVGEYKDGNFQGQGTFTWSNGDKYVGEYKDGNKDGQGTFTFASGENYVGEYKDGNKDGQGTFTFTSGSKYVGEWKDDKHEGKGIYYDDLLSKDGVFKNGELWDGIYTSHQATGIIYKIYYNAGEPTDTFRNDRNYYINEDIIGEDIFCTKKLLNQNNKFKIRCNINNISIKWIFDTGAETISIAASEWDKIKSEIDFEDLKISAKSMGVGGFQTGKMIRINDEITIGCYSVKNTVVYITNGEYNLMGIGFLNKFSNVEWNMKESTIKLFK